jgi:hypothetical protein
MQQAIHDADGGAVPIVAHRRNNDGWLVTMRFADWIALYRERDINHCLDNLDALKLPDSHQ